MTDRLRHRGPDDEGWWLDAEAGIGLGSRRLSIIDLSPAGHQPMCSACGRFVIAYNGEIYNFADVRKELEAKAGEFRGHSDTEVLVEAIARWGLTPALSPLRRHVRLRPLGPRRADASARPRPARREAAVLRPRWAAHLLFGSELKALRDASRLGAARSTATRCRCFSGTATSLRRTRSIACFQAAARRHS